MVNIGEIIAKLRKEADLTQEALANMLGVSAQAISKWETGTTMPDIMLLPIIADVFDTDIDTLFCRQKKSSRKNVCRENIHEELYDTFFEGMQDLWAKFEASSDVHTDAQKAQSLKHSILSQPHTHTLVLSNSEGNGVYANCDIALSFVKNKDEIEKLYEEDTAWTVIKRFADGETRNVYKFILQNREKNFTSAFISAKCNIDIKAVERALDNLLRMSLVRRMDVVTDDSTVYIYSSFACYKLVLVNSMLALASRLGDYHESYRGFLA